MRAMCKPKLYLMLSKDFFDNLSAEWNKTGTEKSEQKWAENMVFTSLLAEMSFKIYNKTK